uniref:Uncharacterized protein n=1 Tax=Rhizophora mucronata TaxID=61149 RepID=A0A2P2QNF6_RHIMU
MSLPSNNEKKLKASSFLQVIITITCHSGNTPREVTIPFPCLKTKLSRKNQLLSTSFSIFDNMIFQLRKNSFKIMQLQHLIIEPSN